MSEHAARFVAPQGFHRFRNVDAVLGAVLIVLGVLVWAAGSLYLQTVVIDGLIVMVLVYSWNVISGFTGYFSFGQVAFAGIGGYAAALLMAGPGLPWPLALPLGALVSAAAAVPLGAVLLRLRGIYFALGTLALSVGLELVATDVPAFGSGEGLTLPPPEDNNSVLAVALVAGAIAVAVTVALSRSRLGLRALAMRGDEDAITVVGVRPMRVKLTMFVISAGLAGLAGSVGAWNAGFVTPGTGFADTTNLQSIVYTLIGGVGSVWGPLLGTGIGQAVITQLGPQADREVEIAFGLLVVLVVTLAPGGVVGLLNRVGLLRRVPILRPPAGLRALVPAPGWLRRHPRPDGELLDCRELTVRFRGVTAVDGVSVRAGDGDFVAIVGANGAGKTTLFNAISGFAPATGTVRLRGRDVSSTSPAALARHGISRTFQIPRLAENLTVWENVLLGSLLAAPLREAQARAVLIIAELGLSDVAGATVATLGPGVQRRIEIARVVAARPQVLLLDEALAGMSAAEIDEVRHAVAALRDWGVDAILSVEHVLSAVRDLAGRMVALDFGRVVAHGSPDDVLGDAAVIGAYLGSSDRTALGTREPAANGGTPAIDVTGLDAGYGQVRVLRGVSLRLWPGEFLGVLGASGAGKTTLCRALTGACTVHDGTVRLRDRTVTGVAPHLLARDGVAHVPSSRELFGAMTVADNLRLGAVDWRGPATERCLARVTVLFPELRELLRRKAATLSGGQQQMVAIGRALMREPSVLILDEPSTGLAPIVVGRLMDALRTLADDGVAVLVVEQNAAETLLCVDRAYVLSEGRVAFEGTAAQLRDDPELARAYLGAATVGEKGNS